MNTLGIHSTAGIKRDLQRLRQNLPTPKRICNPMSCSVAVNPLQQAKEIATKHTEKCNWIQITYALNSKATVFLEHISSKVLAFPLQTKCTFQAQDCRLETPKFSGLLHSMWTVFLSKGCDN